MIGLLKYVWNLKILYVVDTVFQKPIFKYYLHIVINLLINIFYFGEKMTFTKNKKMLFLFYRLGFI